MSKRKKSSRNASRLARQESSFALLTPCATAVSRPTSILKNPTCLATAVCFFLILIVGLVFGQTLSHGFINYDDDKYVYNNPFVVNGFGVREIAWAFTTNYACNWHSLTWLSHMLDCQVYGLVPGGHHLTNILLHAATAIILFLTLRRMTGDFWPSAFVAAVFAIHPLHVESVAWVAERKDVLSALFFTLTLAAYIGYVRHPFSLIRYLTVILLFALGLMAKPMLVTLPFVLLLLDYWPLRRMTVQASKDRQFPCDRQYGRSSILPGLLIEKIPLLMLAAASCAVTIWAQHKAILAQDHIPLILRMGNAAVSYVAYLGQSFYPADLAVLYPYPKLGLSMWKIAFALLVLAAITCCAVALKRRYPYLLMGWLWYLGMLMPVIGLLQVGTQSMADRYTYLPQIGLCIAIVWGIAQVTRQWPYSGWICGVASLLVVTALVDHARRQTSYWTDSETLWRHTLLCTSQNSLAHNNLGKALYDKGRMPEAIQHFQQALKINPNYALACNNLGGALAKINQLPRAIELFRQALLIEPDYAEAHSNLGLFLDKTGRRQEALEHLKRALIIDPDLFEAHDNMGLFLIEEGRLHEAIDHYRRALELKPDLLDAQHNLGIALVQTNQPKEAIEYLSQTLHLNPNQPEIQYYLGLALYQLGRPAEAIEHLRIASNLKPDYAEAQALLAIIHAKINQSD
jgi:protein O-mannosyl-transferase